MCIRDRSPSGAEHGEAARRLAALPGKPCLAAMGGGRRPHARRPTEGQHPRLYLREQARHVRRIDAAVQETGAAADPRTRAAL
eukprot:3010481-Alexandrium_andersonii.AAC.1